MRQFILHDPPHRNISAPKSATQAAIEETYSFDGPPDALITVTGNVYLYFGGNGYLGLQANPEVLASTCEAVLHYGVGTATNRIAFTSPPVFEVERRVAELLGTDSALYTASGCTANQIMLESLEKTFERIFIDEAAHHSMFDAARRIHKKRCFPITFRHRSAADLKDKLDKNLQMHERPIVLTDGVFSQHAATAPLDEYIELLSHYDGASLWIDDAQGFGVLGETGRGTLEHFGIDTSLVNKTPEDTRWDGNEKKQEDYFAGYACGNTSAGAECCPLYLTVSLSKAAGGCGGVIAGSETFIQRIKDRSAAYFGASAPATPIAAATAKALSILAEPQLRRKLKKNVMFLKAGLHSIGIETDASPLPMVILTLGSAANMKRIQRELSEKGILVSYLPRNTGLGSEGALRIAVFATHNETMIQEFTSALSQCI
ncbi:8-amino-7-oxononanoate synthase 1 [Planctomycetales bacterium]|nr:8-amino-7-oxononanoate synthase 1 [Planctomycetales bacterium]